MFQKFMGNKDFHPATYQNLKKVWEAEENEKAKKKRQEELRLQYLKEQEVQDSKQLLGRAHPLSFMYEPPPGFKKDGGKDGEEEEAKEKKFEWQRSDRAPPPPPPLPPSEGLAKGSSEVTEQPFGVEVRKVKCLKCGGLGHVNTDSICPLYGQNKQLDESMLSGRTLSDLDAREDGFIFKRCVLDRVLDSTSANQLILGSDEEDYEQQLLEQLTEKEKRLLLKKIKKMEKKSKHKHKRKKQKQRTSSREVDEDEGDSSDEADKPRTAHRQSKALGPQPAGSPNSVRRRHKSPDSPSPDGRYGHSSARGGSYSKDRSYSKSSCSRESSYSRGSYSKGSYSKEKGRPMGSQEDLSKDNSDHHFYKGRGRSRSPVHMRDSASETAKERSMRGRSPRSGERRRSPRSGKRRREGESARYSEEDGINRGSGSREHDQYRTERASRTAHRRHS